MSSSKTLVFCCNTLWGLVNFRGRVIRALVDDGHRVVLVARKDVPLERVHALGAEFIEWELAPRGTSLLREAMALAVLLRIYRRIQPDLAFHFTIKPVMYGALVCWLSGVPCVSVITGLGFLFLKNDWKSRLGKILYRLTLHRSREVWFLNGDDSAYFDRAGLLSGVTNRTLSGEGIDVNHFGVTALPPIDTAFVFLMIARLVKDKGLVEFVTAARSIKASHPQARFQILGPAYSANGMSVSRDDMDRWVREGIIEYLGEMTDVRPAIAAAHCIVLPSYREGMPRVLMEAAAMGRPSVATDVPGCRDVVVDGQTGRLCFPRDAVSLAQTCEAMLRSNPKELEAMASKARQLAVDLFDDRIVIRIYREAVQTLACSFQIQV